MANAPARRYMDSNAIIHLVYNEPEYSGIVQALIEEAGSGAWVLVVSSLTLLEVTRKPSSPVDPAKIAVIMNFFENPYVFVREIDLPLVERALKLIYSYTWLYPQDAAHLAAALETKCQVFYTYDSDLLTRFNGEFGLSVERPTMPTLPAPPKAPSLDELPLFQQTSPLEND